MKNIAWSDEKNKKLQAERGVCFEDIFTCLINEKILDIVPHPNKDKYPDQMLYIIDLKGYVYVVPVVEDEKQLFLKTIFASRKMTKKYLKERLKK